MRRSIQDPVDSRETEDARQTTNLRHRVIRQDGREGAEKRPRLTSFFSHLSSQFVVFAVVLFAPCALLHAQSKPSTTLLRSAAGYDSLYGAFTINNLTSWHRYDGLSNASPSGENGSHFPYSREGAGNVIFRDGFIWGGKVFRDSGFAVPFSMDPYNQNIRVGGSHYDAGTRAGAVKGIGAVAAAESSWAAGVRMYRIRRDYARQSDNLRREAQIDLEYPTIDDVPYEEIDRIRDRYDRDWTEWPAQKGAPFIDRNGNGAFDPPPRFNLYDWEGPLFTDDSLGSQGRDEPGVGAPGSHPPDQVLWMVYNDLDTVRTKGLEGSLPLGLEVRKTVWGYEWPPPLRDMYFTWYHITNKGGVDTSDAPGEQQGAFWIDSLYFMQWSDVDLGTFVNDLVGCDTLLDAAFCYNGTATDDVFEKFGAGPPAVGYALIAGPAVPDGGSRAVGPFGMRDGVRAGRMSSFGYWSPGGWYDPPPGYVVETGEWWHALRGYLPYGDLTRDPAPFAFPPGGSPSPYPLSGDPIARTGHLDGQGTYWSFFYGERRMWLSTGPIRLAPGESQDVIVATVAGLGADNLSSLQVMKYNMRRARLFAENEWRPPAEPQPPSVRAIPLDGAVLLEWGSDLEAVRQTESGTNAGLYAFEGYNVYMRSPDVSLYQWTRVATYDRVNGVTDIIDFDYDLYDDRYVNMAFQQGIDRGVKRYHLVTRDENNQPLVNGTTYTFSVTAYTYTADETYSPRTLESGRSSISVAPGRPFEQNLTTSIGDTIAVHHESGSGTTRVVPIVIDPTAGTGDLYEVSFDTMAGTRTWSVRNVSASTPGLSGQTNFTNDDDYMMIDGGVLLIVKDEGGSPAGAGDIYTFAIPAPETGPDVEKKNAERVGVFPNPVYLTSDEHLGQGGGRWVTFINLPERATIRIYNLAGHLVQTIHKDSPSIFQKWDLTNKDRWLVASGIYVVHIEFPDLGTSKILKLAVIQGYPLQ